ncbi:MAG: NlpC/P60 family protein [Candidatus Marinimicrobia bacterium]|nr:NlpC/P60 family protein [Candidatus Neomarinimicrobiota bacterium]
MKKIIKTPFANMYDDASFSSQLVTQGLIWDIAEQLDRKGDWVRLRLTDGYEAWSQDFSTLELSPETGSLLNTLPRLTVHTPFLSIYDNPAMKGQRMGVLTMGASVPYLEQRGEDHEILLPGGRHGHVRQPELTVTDPRDIILCSAGRILGASYFWGGKTENGCDCSGLTQMCFRIAGLSLPRDAGQQIKRLKEDPVSLRRPGRGILPSFRMKRGISCMSRSCGGRRNTFMHPAR